ncbi:MAG: hypothetical protein KC931_26105 [Candidatus Omnitrophica bacterium]|nr:hypothetical protein [Candidatus Omnitrophota bacterium]
MTEEEKNPTVKSYKGAEWIERLLKDVTIEKARVFGMDGWIQQELTPLLFRHFAPEIARYLPEYAVPLLSRDLIWESNRIKAPLPCQLRSDSMSRHDIYIFDLADQETIHRVAREDPKFGHLRTLQFSHGFDLPVGVGFSITMVPTILPKTPVKNRSGRGETVVFPWKSLLQNLEETVFSEDNAFEGGNSYRAKFEEIGIEMGYKEGNNQDQK